MPIKRGKKQKKKKKKAFLKAVDDFVTSNTEEKFDVLIRICEEAKERFLIELLDCFHEEISYSHDFEIVGEVKSKSDLRSKDDFFNEVCHC